MSHVADNAVRSLTLRSVRGTVCTDVTDRVAVEEPLEIRLAHSGDTGPGRVVSVTMRTPGHDEELAVGFLHGEGLIRSQADLEAVGPYGISGNVVRVALKPGVQVELARLERNFYTTSSCGVCGKTSIEAATQALPSRVGDPGFAVEAGLLRSLAERARVSQDVFGKTGGLHASTLFDAHGELLLTREDVGRHNALDKLVGARLRADALPLAACILLLSGRASFELLQKATAAGVPVVAAIGAPSSLAVEFADQAGIMLVGFLRGESFNVYTHAERLR